ncbi:alpha/beta hydrolase [Kineococcus rhizosphaerae]|uniref:Acetyl esterase n=1 Tax=Kineococcus rhizosphaerae TaxID=559628 RepID=A0A2T0QXS3_9ACTN|nr:alpha/beta hydrolase [Kineococcus rhizosphaerae]PRY10825.1 acetyl esterase [Kineococcus rhizosphaerae]
MLHADVVDGLVDGPELDERLTDPQAALVVARRRAAARGVAPRHLAGLAVARARARRGGPGPVDDADLLVADVAVRAAAGPRPARTYVPRAGHAGTVLFLHGGGWALGDLDTDDHLCRALAVQAGVAVVSLAYRLAPEHPFPAGLDDAATVLGDLADGSFPAPAGPLTGPLAVAGAGAGGQLAALLALHCRRPHTPAVRHQLLFCPLLDGDLTRGSHQRYGDGGLGLGVEDLAWFWRMYVPDRAARRLPRVSPLRTPDLTGSVPATVVVAGADPARDEGLAYARALREAGTRCRPVLVEGVPHGFAGDPELAAGERAVRAAAEHLRATFDAPRVVDLRDRQPVSARQPF